MGTVGEAVRAKRAISRVLGGGPRRRDGVGELEGERGAIGHRKVVSSQASGISREKVNILIINILNTYAIARRALRFSRSPTNRPPTSPRSGRKIGRASCRERV